MRRAEAEAQVDVAWVGGRAADGPSPRDVRLYVRAHVMRTGSAHGPAVGR